MYTYLTKVLTPLQVKKCTKFGYNDYPITFKKAKSCFVDRNPLTNLYLVFISSSINTVQHHSIKQLSESAKGKRPKSYSVLYCFFLFDLLSFITFKDIYGRRSFCWSITSETLWGESHIFCVSHMFCGCHGRSTLWLWSRNYRWSDINGTFSCQIFSFSVQ